MERSGSSQNGCEGVAEFYDKFPPDELEVSRSKGLFGTQYSVILNSKGMPQRVFCGSNLWTHVTVESDMGKHRRLDICYRNGSVKVNLDRGELGNIL